MVATQGHEGETCLVLHWANVEVDDEEGQVLSFDRFDRFDGSARPPNIVPPSAICGV